MIRTHDCAQLGKNNISEKVELAGWIDARRDHGQIIFMDLRDKHGRTQIVFDPEKNPEAYSMAHTLGSEWCVKVSGTVAQRPEGTVNSSIPTGEIEVDVEKIDVLSRSQTPPFEIKDEINVSEELRLKYRYLDLRRPVMQKKLDLKYRVQKTARDILDEQGFMDVETPLLTKSTPEGARDFLVPSRVQPGKFYALPQSPQIFKQILMVSGVEKYYQIAKCFRDEDLRADRQPEFTQLDMEMSFVEQDDVLNVSETVIKGILERVLDIKYPEAFPRMSYREAMEKYGSDKPDTRFGLLIEDLTEHLADSRFNVFKKAIDNGGKVKAIRAPGYAGSSRAQIDKLTDFVKGYGAKGLAFFKIENGVINSPISKFFSEEELQLFKERVAAEDDDMIFMLADDDGIVSEAMGELRLKIAREKDLIDKEVLSFLWVVDFPLFKYNEENGRWVSEHHPFTGFSEEDDSLIEAGELSKVRSKSYDLVLNGNEVASGSIRIFRRDRQKKIFDVLGLKEEEVAEKFGFLMESFKYAPPPHGGIAFGLDRIIAILLKEESIREVIPFPKTQKAACPLSGAPTEVDEKQLTDLGLEVKYEQMQKEGL